jgi:hypothetical protein
LPSNRQYDRIDAKDVKVVCEDSRADNAVIERSAVKWTQKTSKHLTLGLKAIAVKVVGDALWHARGVA